MLCLDCHLLWFNDRELSVFHDDAMWVYSKWNSFNIVWMGFLVIFILAASLLFFFFFSLLVNYFGIYVFGLKKKKIVWNVYHSLHQIWHVCVSVSLWPWPLRPSCSYRIWWYVLQDLHLLHKTWYMMTMIQDLHLLYQMYIMTVIQDLHLRLWYNTCTCFIIYQELQVSTYRKIWQLVNFTSDNFLKNK